MTTYSTAPPVPSQQDSTASSTAVDIRAALASEWCRERLRIIAAATPRARQAQLGPSEIGQECPRRIGYRIAHTPIINHADPLKALFGTGLHAVIAAGLLNTSSDGRFLVEQKVSYRGITGTVDLYDRWTHRLTDWKTTGLSRIRHYQRSGVPIPYLVQARIYAEAMIAAGEEVRVVAITFIPRDSDLTDVWTYVTTPDQDQADLYIDRYLDIEARVQAHGPAALDAVPSNLCPYCPNYRPDATDLSVACPGKDTA